MAPPSYAQLQQQQQQQQQQASSSGRHRCAEVCMELLALESVRFFTARQGGPAAPAALEAMGIRVGKQLAERWGLCMENPHNCSSIA